MKLHFLRNATFIIEHEEDNILIDPMLGAARTMPAFSIFRHKRLRNPIVPLPDNSFEHLSRVTTALITHFHPGYNDHLDVDGRAFLISKQITTYCSQNDEQSIAKGGVHTKPLLVGKRQPFLNGHITPIPAVHGYGWISKFVGPGVGYFIELANAPSIYISGDTVLTDDVKETLVFNKPDIAIVAAGNASVDIGKPILMHEDDILEFAKLAPGLVIANHLEALNHCPMTRVNLKKIFTDAGLKRKTKIPKDGETINC